MAHSAARLPLFPRKRAQAFGLPGRSSIPTGLLAAIARFLPLLVLLRRESAGHATLIVSAVVLLSLGLHFGMLGLSLAFSVEFLHAS
jgi:hypothetical protein